MEFFKKFSKNELKAVKVAAQHTVLAAPHSIWAAPCNLLAVLDSHGISRQAWSTLGVLYMKKIMVCFLKIISRKIKSRTSMKSET